MRKAVLITLLLLAVVALAALATWWFTRPVSSRAELVLHGNVDLRQVDLPFNGSERIASVLVEEGDRVQKGQLLATLDTSRLVAQVAQVHAQVAAQRQVVERLQNGTRPEEIAQARANVEAAKADAANALASTNRLKALIAAGATTEQEYDDVRARLDVAQAKVVVNEKTLALALAGPRKEDIAEAEARLEGNQAQLALLEQYLADARLLSPTAGVVRTRIMEPGEMATPQKPVVTLAIVDPKWVRAYVTEPDLGHVRPGGEATVSVDSFPTRRYAGWVGFISPVAEFTPKTVQTDELRTSLVYEVRVYVKDAGDDLRLGMPATVYLPLQAGAGPATAPGTASASRPVAGGGG
jgi:membrane fusion protein PltH